MVYEIDILHKTPQPGMFPSSFTRFPAKYLQIPWILTKFAMKLHIMGTLAINGMVSTNSLMICDLCNIFHFMDI